MWRCSSGTVSCTTVPVRHACTKIIFKSMHLENYKVLTKQGKAQIANLMDLKKTGHQSVKSWWWATVSIENGIPDHSHVKPRANTSSMIGCGNLQRHSLAQHQSRY